MAGSLSGKHVLYDVSMIVNSVDLSNEVEMVTIRVGMEQQKGDAMGDIQRYNFPGLQTVTDPKVTWYQDFAAAKVYATLYAAWAARSVFNIVAKGQSGANATTNPAWTIPVFVADMPVFVGTHGDRHMADVTFSIAGNISVATS